MDAAHVSPDAGNRALGHIQQFLDSLLHVHRRHRRSKSVASRHCEWDPRTNFGFCSNLPAVHLPQIYRPRLLTIQKETPAPLDPATPYKSNSKQAPDASYVNLPVIFEDDEPQNEGVYAHNPLSTTLKPCCTKQSASAVTYRNTVDNNHITMTTDACHGADVDASVGLADGNMRRNLDRRCTCCMRDRSSTDNR